MDLTGLEPAGARVALLETRAAIAAVLCEDRAMPRTAMALAVALAATAVQPGPVTLPTAPTLASSGSGPRARLLRGEAEASGCRPRG